MYLVKSLSRDKGSGRYTMYLPFSPYRLLRAKWADTLCICQTPCPGVPKNSHTTPQKITPDEEDLLCGCSPRWCVVRGPRHTFLQRVASRGVQFYFAFAVLRSHSFMQQNEPLLPYDLHPKKGTPVKHRLIFVLPVSSSPPF